MLKEEHFLAEPGDADLDHSVYEAKDREDDKKDPPDPEDEEIVLVEQIVGENTKNILVVHISTTCNSSRANIT